MGWDRFRGARKGAIAWGTLSVVLVSAAGLAFTGAAAAAAASSEERSWDVTFSGTSEVTSISPEGVSEVTSYDRSVHLRCTSESCAYYEYYSETDVMLSADTPSGSTSWPAEGDYCSDEPWNGPGTATISFSGTTLTIDSRVEGSGWQDCGDGGRSAIYGQNEFLAAAWVDGELCTLTGDPCPDLGTAGTVGAAGGDGEAGAVPAASSSRLATGSPAAPSILSGLATPASAGTAPGQLALAALLTVVLVLLVAFPTSLLNSAVEAGSDRWAEWRAAGRARRAAPPAEAAGRAAHPQPSDEHATRPWWWAALGVAAAALISAFVDPGFGFNPGSGRVLLSILVSFAIDVALGWSLVIWLMRRATPGVTHSFVFRPMTLLIVVAAVVFTRVTGFEPGILFGLVAGVAFGALAGKASEAKAALVTLGYAFAAALIAWILFGMLGGAAASGDSFWHTFLLETLASVAIAGMAVLPVALFPVRGMPGYALWAWSRWVWGACYAVGLLAFFVVLLPMPFSWAGVGWDLAAWIGVYLAYAIGAVIVWALITRPWVRRGADAAPTAADDASDVELPSADAADATPAGATPST